MYNFKNLLPRTTIEMNNNKQGFIVRKDFKKISITLSIDITQRNFGAQPGIIQWINDALNPIYTRLIEINDYSEYTLPKPTGNSSSLLKYVKNQHANHIKSIIINPEDKRINGTREVLLVSFCPSQEELGRHIKDLTHKKILRFINIILNNTPESSPFKICELAITQNAIESTRNQRKELCEDVPEWRLGKTDSKGVFLANKKNEYSCLDIFSTRNNYNVFSFFNTTSGGVDFMKEIFTNILHRDGHVIVFDASNEGSYLSRLLQGHYVELNPEETSINPFWAVKNEEDILNKHRFFLHALASYTRPITMEEQDMLDLALVESFHTHKGTLEINHIHQYLHSKYETLANLISTFTEGFYGKLFNGEPNVSFGNPLTFLNFNKFKTSPSLCDTIMSASYISAYTYLKSKGKLKKKAIVTTAEALSIIKTNKMTPLTASILETSKEWNISNICFTHQLEDASKEGTVQNSMLTKSDWFISGKTRPQEVTILNKIKGFNSPDVEKELKNTISKPHSYSEFFIQTGENFGRFKFYHSPSSFAFYSTKIDHQILIEQNLKNGNKVEAIMKLSAHVEQHEPSTLFKP